MILIIIGLVIATAIGLNIPFLSASEVLTHVLDILVSQAHHIGPILYGFPIFWVLGFALGIWKG